MSGRHVFLCPVCGKGSTSEQDAEDGYCGRCRAQTGLPVRLAVGHVTAIIGHLDRTSDASVIPQLVNLLLKAAATLACEFVAQGERPAP